MLQTCPSWISWSEHLQLLSPQQIWLSFLWLWEELHDKCQEVVILIEIYGTFCNLLCKLSRKKAQDTERRWKTSNQVQQGKNRQNYMFTPLPSSPARHGELTKEKIGREPCFLATSSPPTRHGEWNHLGGEQGRFCLPRMTWHKPNGEESYARHGEQE